MSEYTNQLVGHNTTAAWRASYQQLRYLSAEPVAHRARVCCLVGSSSHLSFDHPTPMSANYTNLKHRSFSRIHLNHRRPTRLGPAWRTSRQRVNKDEYEVTP